jgi:rubrerythrin
MKKITINKEDKKSLTKELERIYNFVYTCELCGTKYGSDKKENKKHICPICEQ